MSTAERARRKVIEGWVVSDKMDKTRVVEVRWSKQDRKYRKILKLTAKLFAHDEKNESKEGNHVRVMSMRPMSKKKCWRITEILGK